MEHIEKDLQKLGLNEKEALFYTHALRLGQFTILEIAKHSSIKRPTCYLIADELIKKGFVTMIPRDKKVLYSVEPPHILIKKAEEGIELAKRLAPELASLYNVSNVQPTVKFYPGPEGIRTAYNDVFNYKIKEYRYVGSTYDTILATGKEFMDDWADKRIKRGVKAFSIRVLSKEHKEDLYTKVIEGLRDIRYAPEHIQLPYTILLYAKKVCVISTKKDSFGFIVESEDFNLTMKGLFDALWQISTPIADMNKPTKKSA